VNGRDLRDAPPWLFWTVAGVVSMVLHFGYRMGSLAAVGIGLVTAVAAVAAVVEFRYRQRR
jgi:hypothetical protein